MRKRVSLAQKVRKMIERGHTTKEIVAKLQCKPQTVYQIRYNLNKAKGLGAIGTPAPVPTAGIGAPPKKSTRKVRAGTGIKDASPTPGSWREITTDELFAKRDQIVTTPRGEGLVPLPITMIEKPTLWQRVVGFFRGA
jgi:hypothetical protein